MMDGKKMENDYISRQAAIAVIYDQHIGGKEACENARPNTYGADLREIVADIEDIPPVDVRPVVRGKWEVVDWVEYDGHGECVHYPKDGLRCTNCKNVFKKELLWKDNYCPNCGCDMGECEE